MKNNLQNSNTLEEKKIDWKVVQSTMKQKLGQDIFDSWLKKMDLIQEFNNYVMISVSTRFIRDWITSRYLDQILQIIKEFKKSIIRIEFVIEDKNQKSKSFENKLKKIIKILLKIMYHLSKSHFFNIIELIQTKILIIL